MIYGFCIIGVEASEMIIGSAIFDLATSDRRDVFLATLFENTVYTWSIATGKKIAEFNTIMDTGGRRLALANSKDVFVAGAYYRYGVACYQLTNGKKLWHRNDLKGVQVIKISPDDTTVFCGFSDKSGVFISLDTGVTIEKVRGLRDIYYDTYNSWIAYDYEVSRRIQIKDINGKRKIEIGRRTFAILDMAFSLGYIGINEAGGPARFILKEDPDKTIYYRPPKGKHIIRIAYSEEADSFFGVQDNCEKRTKSILLRFDLSLDEPSIVTKVERSNYAFCDKGRHLITSHGQYINTLNGMVEKEFDFPQKEYVTYGSDEDE